MFIITGFLHLLRGLIFRYKTKVFRELSVLPSSGENFILVVPVEGANSNPFCQTHQNRIFTLRQEHSKLLYLNIKR